jgi:hypothetical protein
MNGFYKTILPVTVVALALLSNSAQAAGWKKGNVARLVTNGYSELNQGQCALWFQPLSGVDMSAECNGQGGQYYVTFDCSATSAPTTGLTKASANINHANAQIAALTDRVISLYIEDVKVNGFCVATQSTLVFIELP